MSKLKACDALELLMNLDDDETEDDGDGDGDGEEEICTTKCSSVIDASQLIKELDDDMNRCQ